MSPGSLGETLDQKQFKVAGETRLEVQGITHAQAGQRDSMTAITGGLGSNSPDEAEVGAVLSAAYVQAIHNTRIQSISRLTNTSTKATSWMA
ncbi:hypothetical protein ACFPRE_00755 [Variovorax soli]|jgi:hypothetical protein|uniref:hypothetical protein n=1 Tax=Variovorax soli TaxID=376815 RepID=UPI0008394C4A